MLYPCVCVPILYEFLIDGGVQRLDYSINESIFIKCYIRVCVSRLYEFLIDRGVQRLDYSIIVSQRLLLNFISN